MLINKLFQNICINLHFSLFPPEIRHVDLSPQYLLKQWFISMLALMGFQLLMFLKSLLTAFKGALFSEGLSVMRKIKDQFITIPSR